MRRDIETTLEDSERSILQLLNTDLDVALTFLEIAVGAEEPDKRTRNLQNAEKAYRSTLDWLGRLHSQPRPDSLEQKLKRLHDGLIATGVNL